MSDQVPPRPPLPSCEDAERALLGAVLLDEAQVWAEGCGSVAIADFHYPLHRAIWEAMLRLRAEHTTIDGITLVDMLARLGYLEAVDKLCHPVATEAFFIGLWADTWASRGCSAHAKMITEYAERRRMIEAGITMVNAGMRGRDASPAIYERDEYRNVDF